MTRVTWTTRDSRTHRIRLGVADCLLDDLMGFQQFTLLFQCCFAQGGGPWLEASWMLKWLSSLSFALDMEKEVLPYRYGADGDFGGGETVIIGGDSWSLNLGAGECSLSQAVGYTKTISPGVEARDARLTKWIDLRDQTRLEVDGGRVIRLSKKKQEYRWYTELPGLLRFLETLEPKEEVRAWSIQSPVNMRKLIRIADEEPSGIETAAEILREQGNKGRSKLVKAVDDPRYAPQHSLVRQLLSLIDNRQMS